MTKFENLKNFKEKEKEVLEEHIIMKEENGIIVALKKGEKTIRLNEEIKYKASGGTELTGRVVELLDPRERLRPIVLEFKEGKRGWFEFEDLFK